MLVVAVRRPRRLCHPTLTLLVHRIEGKRNRRAAGSCCSSEMHEFEPESWPLSKPDLQNPRDAQDENRGVYEGGVQAILVYSSPADCGLVVQIMGDVTIASPNIPVIWPHADME
ncbi:hypothetical protein F4802DRAFT_603358 [Xylaria palmicola]|nr:hypothetical protein F4802DRAFT_603358 [Xylaria palmicola]